MPDRRFAYPFNSARASEMLARRPRPVDVQEGSHQRLAWYVHRTAIMQRWAQLAGPASPVGLPLDPTFPLSFDGSGSRIEFRGGSLSVRNHSPETVELSVTNRVVVSLEGFGLDIRQEKGDEVYGTIDCKVGTTGYKQSFDLPQVTLGPETNNRVWPSSIVLWEGPPADLNIIATVAEHDEGDREEVRQAVRMRVRQVFEQGSQLIAGAIPSGSELRSAADAFASEASSNNALAGWAINAVGDLVNDVLGMGDDLYNPVSLTISASEMMQPPPVQTYRCWDDARTIQHTHSRTISCGDDAGDQGQITMLFLVRRV